jgi:hypothetical protein
VAKGAPKSAIEIPATDIMVSACFVNLGGQATSPRASIIVVLMSVNTMKLIRRGGLEVIAHVDILVWKTMISKGVPDYVLNARIASIEIDLCKLISVRLMIAITYFGDGCLDRAVLFIAAIFLNSK